MKKRLHFVGDVHGAFGDLQDCIDRVAADQTIQVGDFGLFWNPNTPGTSGFTRPVSFIDGNHDNHPVLRSDETFHRDDWPNNTFYIPRASSWDVPVAINFLGGADSIDKHLRVEGISWWREEIPSGDEFGDFAELPPAKIIVTHTAPKSVLERFTSYRISDPTAHMLDRFLEISDYHPELWVFGHMHEHFDEVIDGTRFVCLPSVHSIDTVDGHDGLIVVVENGEIINDYYCEGGNG